MAIVNIVDRKATLSMLKNAYIDEKHLALLIMLASSIQILIQRAACSISIATITPFYHAETMTRRAKSVRR